MPDFKLPDLGEGVTEAEVDRWLVKEGETIAEDDPLVEVITDKATAEIPSPFEGVVSKIHVEAGEIVRVGTVLVTIDGDQASATPSPAAATARLDAVETDERSDGKVKAMPPVRKLASDLGIDIADVQGSGPGGRILREDVEMFARRRMDQDPSAAGPPAVTPRQDAVEADRRPAPRSGAETATPGRREPLRGVRRLIAQRMAEAHRIVPPVTHVEECDVTELDATRKLANERNPDLVRLTFMPFIIKAVVAGLKDYPALNASLDEAAEEIVYHDRYDIGIAVDTPSGLMVPVVRDADNKRLRDVASEVERLAKAAREGALRSEDLRDPTFTVSSPGPFGGVMATPIVFHPQSAILGVHRASERPVVRDGQIVIRLMMNLSITFDHRILDGMTAAKFVLDVARLLEHPAALALES